jgi:large subunit ribosomal protein L33
MGRIENNYIKLKCKKCGKVNYRTKKNKKKLKENLELSKFCDTCKSHTDHLEVKK